MRLKLGEWSRAVAGEIRKHEGEQKTGKAVLKENELEIEMMTESLGEVAVTSNDNVEGSTENQGKTKGKKWSWQKLGKRETRDKLKIVVFEKGKRQLDDVMIMEESTKEKKRKQGQEQKEVNSQNLDVVLDDNII